MDINFELYKVFYYVAKNLSFSKASAELFISQSAVSQAVKLLEQKMNCRLFIRNTKQVKLTPEGDILFRHVDQAFNFIRAGERSINEVHSMKHGEVRIGATDTICKHYLLPHLETFHHRYPQVKIHITNRTSPQCLELLKSGSLDVIVVNLPEKQTDKELSMQKIKDIQDVFIAGPGFSSLEGREFKLRELARYPLLMLEKHTTSRDFIDAFLSRKGIDIIPEIELESVELLVEMAKIGLGISLVVSDYIAQEVARKEVFILNIKEKIPARGLGIVTNNNLAVPVAAQKFIELLGPARRRSPAV